MKVVGAGVGRTGTLSLRVGLQHLLRGPCYHTYETFERPDDCLAWRAALRGHSPDWRRFLAPYVATVDWPAAAFWRELHQAFPDALVLLSVREPDVWWESVRATLVPPLLARPRSARQTMFADILVHRFTADLTDRDAAIAAYLAHNAEVEASIPANQLLEWHPEDGWTSLCEALGGPIPSIPFPHLNSRIAALGFAGPIR